MASTHQIVHIKNNNHTDSMNGKAQHTHIPRVYNGVDKTFNSMAIPGGGCLECGICGEILQDTAAL